jgi:hypothetical protein
VSCGAALQSNHTERYAPEASQVPAAGRPRRRQVRPERKQDGQALELLETEMNEPFAALRHARSAEWRLIGARVYIPYARCQARLPEWELASNPSAFCVSCNSRNETYFLAAAFQPAAPALFR